MNRFPIPILILMTGFLAGPLAGVELATNLQLEIVPMDGVTVEYRWLVGAKPAGAGDPQVPSGLTTLSGTSAVVPVVLPDAQPGTYQFRAEVTANGLTSVSPPVNISVVATESGMVVQPAANGGGSGGGCGVGGGIALMLALSLLRCLADRQPSRRRTLW